MIDGVFGGDCCGAQHGDDGPFDGVRDSPVDHGSSEGKSAADGVAIYSTTCGCFGYPPPHLAEHNPGVAARAAHGSCRQCPRDVIKGEGFYVGVGPETSVNFFHRRRHGVCHVGSGIGIGDGKDIHGVDFRPVLP